MEDRALYQSVLAAPHDDAARLVYADWLDDRTEALAEPEARRLRARAELIRVQVALARSGPGGWRRDNPRPPELVARERRLLFRIGRKVRGEVPLGMASAPFDRGFLRPFRALRPHEFLVPLQDVSRPWMARFPYRSRLPELLPDGADPWNAAPLWDVHLFASTWAHDPEADRGQYGPALDEVGQSPRMERVGWLKVSFARTPVLNFLRHGRFPNVETLVLNSGPFPAVLHAVSENESFRSLRYILFGDDEWVWATTFANRVWFREVARALAEVNDTNPAFGATGMELGRVVNAVPPPPPPVVTPLAQYSPPTPLVYRPPEQRASNRESVINTPLAWIAIACALCGGCWLVTHPSTEWKPAQAPAVPKQPVAFDFDSKKYQLSPEVLKALKHQERPDAKLEIAPLPRPRE